ncbi:hypothetical protein EHS25_008137 [Saitozyma podzolica]|uniref:Uncharacterized protein n=1 Tax=Saitozyma podzolica TaxID=1890683 RepID=A0A427YNI7_9TREE|nr:hypothetical protein EHS25_008137 [Saitozyma podzolica]
MLFSKIKAKLHLSHPLAQQRDEFLAVGPDTPIEKKSHFTSDVVGAAAAFEAWKLFEKHDMHQEGGKVAHARGKEVIGALAAAQVIKLVDERKIPFTQSRSNLLTTREESEKDKKKFIGAVQAQAKCDAKRALRESGFYESRELEAPEADELAGHKAV